MTSAALHFIGSPPLSNFNSGVPEAVVYIHGDAQPEDVNMWLKNTEEELRRISMIPGCSQHIHDPNRAAAFFIKCNPTVNTFVYMHEDIDATYVYKVYVGTDPWKSSDYTP